MTLTNFHKSKDQNIDGNVVGSHVEVWTEHLGTQEARLSLEMG